MKRDRERESEKRAVSNFLETHSPATATLRQANTDFFREGPMALGGSPTAERGQGPSQLTTDFCKCLTLLFYAPHSKL